MFQAVKVSATHRAAADVLILGHFAGAGLDKASAALASDPAIAAALKRPEATGERGSIVEAFPAGKSAKSGEPRVIIVGLGNKDTLTPVIFRDIAATIGKRLAAIDASTAHVHIETALQTLGAAQKRSLGGYGQALGESLGLLAWSRDHFKGSATDLKKRPALTLCCLDKSFSEGVSVGLALAESTNYARTLSEAPPNIATPDFIAAEAQRMAKRHGLSCRVIRGKDLEANGLTGIKTVGQASENKPCFVRLEYKPEKSARSRKPVVLVGKNMTYDTGGLSLKGTENMLGMKRDMDGGAAVFGAMHAIATVIRPNRPVVGLLSVAENSVSDSAYRPDDVYRFRNGVTVEVTNTDAEGRLVLADALVWACEEENPACIIDLATLTGGVVVALGKVYAGYWCEDADLRAKLEAASDRTGERLWRLPMHEEYREMMRSDIADILNSAPVREAHPIQGAAFLSYFVKPGIPWAHIDIAGVHAVKAEKGPFAKSSATGFGVRLLAAFLDAE